MRPSSNTIKNNCTIKYLETEYYVWVDIEIEGQNKSYEH